MPGRRVSLCSIPVPGIFGSWDQNDVTSGSAVTSPMAGTDWLKRIIGKGKPLYRIERRIEETGELFNDGEHIIYVNGADRDSSTALGRLMHDFFCTDPDDMNYQQLAKKARFFKENEEGKAAMCKVLEDMRNETAERKSIEIAQRMLEDGMEIEKVAKYSGLKLEKIQELAQQRSA